MIATKEWVKSLLSKLLKQNDIYSYTERRIGTWVNGKPLYRKCYNWGVGPNKVKESRSFSQIGIPDGSMLYKIETIYTYSGGAGPLDINNNPGATTSILQENNKLSIDTKNTLNILNMIFILEYTKP